MGLTINLGRRIELVSMDPHFYDISIALYRQMERDGSAFQIHSYSNRKGTVQRMEFVQRVMTVFGGLESVAGEACKLRFSCCNDHSVACRHIFLGACKVDPLQFPEPRPLHILDKKSGRTVTVASHGDGVYQVRANGEELDKDSRIAAVASGLIKLGKMQRAGSSGDCVAFDCGHAHDSLVGLLLVRALNVRAVLREQEMAAARGVLSAPSAQT